MEVPCSDDRRWFTTSDGNLSGVSRACISIFDALLAEDCTVAFLGEADLLPSRASPKPEDLQWWSTVINPMLTQIRASGKKVLLMGATNYHDRLDPALVRPRRLEQRVVLPAQTEAEVQAIFEHYLNGEIASSDLIGIIPFAMGSTPAAIAAWVRAARAAARCAGRGLELADLMAVVVPPDTRSPEDI